jgi:RNA polymerase sigma factor (sigma-70 family)
MSLQCQGGCTTVDASKRERPLKKMQSARDISGMEQLAARYRVPLRRFFERRMKASFETEDLAQEVFVRLIRQGNMNDIRHLDGYVFQIAANVLRDHARRWAVREEERFHAPLSDDLLEGGFSPERVLLGQEAIERVIAALHELPEKTQVIFALYHFESVSQVEIARRLNMSINTLEKHMSRANMHLLTKLRESEESG